VPTVTILTILGDHRNGSWGTAPIGDNPTRLHGR